MKEYVQPTVTLGDTVFWRHEAHAEPSAAIVTAVTPQGIEVAVLHAGYRNFSVFEQVHHVGHPDKNYPMITQTGVWEHRSQEEKPLVHELPISKGKK